MGNRTAKFISALIGSIIAGVPLAAVSQNAPTAPSAASTANAASDCLASPKGTAPQGQHWFYRLERATKRQCWYLRAEGSKATQSAQQASVDTTPSAASSAPQSVQNARAEYVAPQSSPTASAPAPAAAATQQAPGATADSNAQQPAVATRWPDAAAAPAPRPSPATTTAPATASAQPAASLAPVTLAAAEIPADKPTGSLQTLLLVIGGALALAGLIASVIYRFAGSRVRVQTADRRPTWDNRQDHDDNRAPWLDAVPARAERPRPVDFDAMRPQVSQVQQVSQVAAFTDEIRRIAAQAPAARVAAVEPDEAQINLFEDEFEADEFEDDEFKDDEFEDDEFEIPAPAPQLAADDIPQDEPIAHVDEARDDEARDEDAVDIDIITAMLERLATEGPRLSQPSLEADLADPARSSRGQSAARA
ncbi:hypothetical protein [Bradyrhizobium sp. BR13661]|jgi:hypothetical protein|uniref:hypothetical protein n=1 Tax=Bradyrhizobium sp. BR13661 TaxID=2940622 RepID=UPI0024749826|nr:hypothetical protein [Bradyrhizobium sp. BR13661]MDH6262464.1 chemotaxis protein histidine kinase CheA [Bradyrhizobium sp. BR13661]